jgi:hypothetical protein
VGILLLLAGTVFAFQGNGTIKGSTMTGVPFWIYAGAGIAVLGLILAVVGFGLGARSTAAESAAAPTTGTDSADPSSTSQ